MEDLEEFALNTSEAMDETNLEILTEMKLENEYDYATR